MSVHMDVDEHLFAFANLDAPELEKVTAAAVGEPVRVRGTRIQQFPYDFGSVPTAGLWRVGVEYATAGGAHGRYDFFVKLLRNPRLWPHLHLIPESMRESFFDYLPWRFELDMYESGIADVLPDGMRMPTLHHVRRIEDAYTPLWWEFVEIDESPWTTADYARTAYLLGQLAARRQVGASCNRVLPEICLRTDMTGALRYYVEGRVLAGMAPILRDAAMWCAPVIADALAALGDTTLRHDMVALADRLPAILDRLDRLPQTFAHGDASPQNLLIPVADRSERIVIDWGFGTPLAIGFDLGQLLVGHAHAGLLGAERLPEVEAAILPAYCAGLAAEGYGHAVDDVRYGFVGGLVARSALCALPLEQLDGPETDDVRKIMLDRLRLTRYLVDMAQSVA